MQIDGRRKIIRDAAGIRERFGVDPPLIPDLLALVGDAADGYPGIPGIGAKTAAQLLNRYGPIENFPPESSRQTARSRAALQESRDAAHRCATLQDGRDTALARCDTGVRGMGGADGSAAATRALRKGCGPMTVGF